MTTYDATIGFRLLSKKQVADVLGYTTRTIDRLVKAGKIPFTYLPTGIGSGRKIKFDSRDIERWIADGYQGNSRMGNSHGENN